MTLVGNDMRTAAELRAGRDGFRQRAWAESYAGFSAARHSGQFEIGDVELLAISAYLSGKASEEAWARAHQLYLATGQVPGRCVAPSSW